jgi:predicted peptidase
MLAAIAPICGGTKADDGLRDIKDVPIWVFHGAKDGVVPISESAGAVAKLNEIGAYVKFTVYPEADHDSWTETYENPAFYKWMFAQRNDSFGF